MIVVGDLHAKTKEPYRGATIKFFEWLLANYKNEEIIYLGDIFDSSSPHANIEHEIINYISQFKHSHLISGNHDQSAIKGNTLLPHKIHSNISVYEDITEIVIEDNNCLILPFKNSYKNYQDLEGVYDYIFLHCMPVEKEFASEGIKLNLKGTYIWGHHHIQDNYTDENVNCHFIIGTPYETRHLENQKHRIFEIKDKKINTIEVPIFFTHETINYGEEPTNKNNILNIKNAPNRKLVFEKYKDYYIREEGIELLRTETTKEDYKKEFEKNNILQKFSVYAKDKNLSKEVLECCSTRLLKIV
jgi:hypothetical protein